MTDFDKLERLVRLRNSGGLTVEEFQAEKAKLLATKPLNTIGDSPPKARTPWIIGGGIAAALVMLVVAFVALQRPSVTGPDNEIAENTFAPARDGIVLASASNAAVIATATPAEGSYAWATSIFRIGENPAYIEKVLGPPKQKNQNLLFYSIQGCVVNYLTKDFEVTGIRISIDDDCTPEVKNRLITPQTTFGSIYTDFGFLQTSCLMLCGNKADPTIEYVVPGPHSDNFIGVSYSTYEDEDDDEGGAIWADEIVKAKGVANVFEVPHGGFYCPPEPSLAVTNAMKNAKVLSVTIGVDVEKCDEW